MRTGLLKFPWGFESELSHILHFALMTFQCKMQNEDCPLTCFSSSGAYP